MRSVDSLSRYFDEAKGLSISRSVATFYRVIYGALACFCIVSFSAPATDFLIDLDQFESASIG